MTILYNAFLPLLASFHNPNPKGTYVSIQASYGHGSLCIHGVEQEKRAAWGAVSRYMSEKGQPASQPVCQPLIYLFQELASPLVRPPAW